MKSRCLCLPQCRVTVQRDSHACFPRPPVPAVPDPYSNVHIGEIEVTLLARYCEVSEVSARLFLFVRAFFPFLALAVCSTHGRLDTLPLMQKCHVLRRSSLVVVT
jgi:hypothetical protein